MRLIDADEFLVDESEAYISAQSEINDPLLRYVNEVTHKKIQMLIADAPTVDAVEVVRCKDCIYHENAYCEDHKTISKTEVYCCMHDIRHRGNNLFCADGRKK